MRSHPVELMVQRVKLLVNLVKSLEELRMQNSKFISLDFMMVLRNTESIEMFWRARDEDVEVVLMMNLPELLSKLVCFTGRVGNVDLLAAGMEKMS
jgi:hypothetical protein